MSSFPVRRLLAGSFLAFAVSVPIGSLAAPTGASAVQGTPSAGDPCAAATPMAGTEMGSAMAGMEMEFDRSYIDMMIPHHASIVAMAQVALTRLEDQRLVEIAERIVETQSAEVEELRRYREDFYGDPEPMAMDEQMMMDMPGMSGSMDEMAMHMDPRAQVAAICAAEDADLAFIDLTIPHHESAITASEVAVDRAIHDEIRAFGERVIEDQRREIDELRAVRAELAGTASPEAGA